MRLEDILEQARGAARDGFPSYWLSQGTRPDILTAHAVIGREIPTLDKVGAAHPADLVVCGDEDHVRAGITAFAGAGATDARVAELCPDPQSARRTRRLLISMLQTRSG